MFRKGSRTDRDDAPTAFVDLGAFKMPKDESGSARVIVAELQMYDDFKPVLDMAYKGSTVIIDMTRFTSGQELKNKVIVAMTDAARDVGGRVMTLSDRTVIFTPNGVRMDMYRNKK